MNTDVFAKGHDFEIKTDKIIYEKDIECAINILYNIGRDLKHYQLMDKISETKQIKIDDIGYNCYIDKIEKIVRKSLIGIVSIDSIIFGNKRLKNDNNNSQLFLNVIIKKQDNRQYQLILTQFFDEIIYFEPVC